MSPSLNAKIAEVFDEPGCDINQSKSAKERKKGCTKQLTPGAAAGGCAFDGAKIALQPIVDVAHLVHGPIACEGNAWDNRHSASSGPQTYRTGFTTDITELDVIYGGEKRLFKAIREVIERQDPAAVFVYQTCVTGMIGDDIEAVCQRAAAKFGKPVIPVNAPGFAGPKNLGNKLGAEALLDHVIGTMEPEHRTPTDINIIGEYNLSGELWQVKPLLDALGVRVLSCISGDGRYREIASAHRARANMMVCSKSMINVATRMQQRWGIPYFEGSFYGISDMSTTLREIARLLVEQGAPDDPVDAGPPQGDRPPLGGADAAQRRPRGHSLIERTEALVAVEEARAWERIRAYRERLAGKKVLLITGGVKSWSVVSALQEAGLEVVGTSVKKSTEEDKEKLKEILGDGADAHMIDDLSPREMYAMLKEARADIMLSGGRSQFVALKARMPWMDINQERHHAFAGYEGMVTMIAEIDKALFNPVWQQVRTPAPWDTADTLLGEPA